jgi:transcriptional regulator GlxA family with amidase domain
MRVEAARQLLATTRLPIKRIAAKCGFGSEETMRRSVLHKVGVTPSEYRSRFSSAERKWSKERREAGAHVR